MTIDEAIKWQQEQARRLIENASGHCEKVAKSMLKQAEHHLQIAEWLELLIWYEQGMEDIPSESGVMPKDIYHTGYDKGYKQGRADERKEWEIAASELLIKYSGDIYEALPDVVEEIQTKAYDKGRADAIDEFMTYSKKWCKEDKVHIQDLTIIAEKLKEQKK